MLLLNGFNLQPESRNGAERRRAAGLAGEPPTLVNWSDARSNSGILGQRGYKVWFYWDTQAKWTVTLGQVG